MKTVKVQRLVTSDPLGHSLLQLRGFRRRGRLGSSATTTTTAGGKVLAGNSVVIGVEAIGISRFQIFLGFLLRRKIGAVVVAGRRGSCPKEEEGRGKRSEKRAEPSDCASLDKC